LNKNHIMQQLVNNERVLIGKFTFHMQNEAYFSK